MQLRQSDLKTFTKCVSDDKVKLNDNQFAVHSYRGHSMKVVGMSSFKASTLIKRFNAGEDPNKVAASELPQWNKAGGRVLPGLVRRRSAGVKFDEKAAHCSRSGRGPDTYLYVFPFD